MFALYHLICTIEHFRFVLLCYNSVGYNGNYVVCLYYQHITECKTDAWICAGGKIVLISADYYFHSIGHPFMFAFFLEKLPLLVNK